MREPTNGPILTLRAAPFRVSQLPPLDVTYDVELHFRGDVVDVADQSRIKLKSGEVIAPPRTVITQRRSTDSGRNKGYDYTKVRLPKIRVIAVTSNDLGNAEAFHFSDGTKVQADWLAAIAFLRPLHR
jgi:hypothetical protein